MNTQNNKNTSDDLLTGWIGSTVISYLKKYFGFIKNPFVEDIEVNIKYVLKDVIGFFLISLSFSILVIKAYISIFETDYYVPTLLDVINPFYGSLLMIYSAMLYIGIFIGTLLILLWTFKKSLFIDLTAHILKLYALIIPFFILTTQLWFGAILNNKLYHPILLTSLSLFLILFSFYAMTVKVSQYLKRKYGFQRSYIKTLFALSLVWIIGSQIPSINVNKVINKRAFFGMAKTIFDEKVYSQEITKEVAEYQLKKFKKQLNIL